MQNMYLYICFIRLLFDDNKFAHSRWPRASPFQFTPGVSRYIEMKINICDKMNVYDNIHL